MSILLEKAQKYQEEKADKISSAQRPDFHVSSPIGWINDPNGWSVFQGEYHLFFQYHPYNTQWGPMHWGHMKTSDFINWKRMPVAMAPDMDYDKNGCFSGGAVEHQGKHILMYTGVSEEEIGHKKEVFQKQCIAIGDGENYIKLDTNPVITAEMLPEGCNVHDFRDPKIWIENDVYYAAIGSKDIDDDGQVVVFKSLDLEKWEYLNCLDKSKFKYGAMWECPDLFELDDHDVLITSPQFMKAQALEFHNGNGTMCIIGKVSEDYQLTRDRIHAIDYGLDFYAPQTLKAFDGRRVMIGWLQSWDNYLTPDEFEWSGIMSIPRVLTIENKRLYQYPVSEIEAFRTNAYSKEITLVAGESYDNLIKGRKFDLVLKIKKMDCDYFEIQLASGDNKYTKISYEPNKEIITFDRTYSGLYKDFNCVRKMKIDPFHEELEIRILMDKYTIEMFVDKGKYAMSSLIYTDLKAENIDFVTDGQVDLVIEKYDICI